MNVREIEQQLGIPRANVRYYEKEGLLHPRRGSNNYRVYTGEDVEALKKIRLLRQLDMPIETIRAVQAGEVSLVDAVVRQERLLENEAAKLERAQAVCRSMLADGVTYAALEPARYENVRPILPGRRQAEPEEPKRPPVEGAEWAFRPWQRYWARTFDLTLACGTVGIVLALVFHVSDVNTDPTLLRTVRGALGWMLLLAVEPLLLCTWGTTPGKRLLGLELRNERGRKLRFSQGVRRTWGVLWVGYGLGIPVYSWYRLYRCYRECDENNPLDYDYEGEFLYYSTAPDGWGLRAAASVALSLLLVLLQVWCGYQALLPPNRGEITKAELAENINVLAKRLDYALWVDEDGYELAAQTMNVQEDGGPWVKYVRGQPIGGAPVYTAETDENGYVTAVTLVNEGGFGPGDNSSPWLHIRRAELAVMAFVGTYGGGYQLSRSPLWRELSDSSQWDGAPAGAGRFTRTAVLEQEGYNVGWGMLVPLPEAESGWFRFTVRIEISG